MVAMGRVLFVGFPKKLRQYGAVLLVAIYFTSATPPYVVAGAVDIHDPAEKVNGIPFVQSSWQTLRQGGGHKMYNRFATARKRYLRTYMDGIYTGMLLTRTLEGHLAEIGESAQAMFDRIVEQMKKAEGVTEQLKAADQMEWVGRMNNIRQRAEEVVLHDLIYN